MIACVIPGAGFQITKVIRCYPPFYFDEVVALSFWPGKPKLLPSPPYHVEHNQLLLANLYPAGSESIPALDESHKNRIGIAR